MRAELIQLIERTPVLAPSLRWIARQYPEGSVTRVQSGLLAGARWERHHRYVNGYWLGQYELAVQKCLAQHLYEGETFFDVGANAGFFTLLACRLGATCVAVDPDPHNAESIQTQTSLNGFRVHIEEAAVADIEGAMLFSFPSDGSAIGHLGPPVKGEEAISVRTTTLNALAKKYGMPKLVKVDIEGAEAIAMIAASDLIAAGATFLFELHGQAAGPVLSRLTEGGYEIRTLQSERLHILALRR